MFCVFTTTIGLLVLLSLSTQAGAEQKQGRRLTLQGIAPAACGLTLPPRETNAENMQLATASPGESSITMPSLLDAGGRVAGGRITIEMNAVCNTEYRVGISSRSGRLVLADTVPENPAFADNIGYRATLDWGAGSLRLDSATNVQASASPLNQPYHGVMRLVVEVDPAPDARPNQAGLYTDTLTIELGASH